MSYMEKLKIKPADFLSSENIQLMVNLDGKPAYFSVSPDLHDRMTVLADEEDLMVSQIVRLLIEEARAV